MPWKIQPNVSGIWQLIAKPTSKAELLQALANEYDASTDQIAQDLEVFLQKMLDNYIVVLA